MAKKFSVNDVLGGDRGGGDDDDDDKETHYGVGGSGKGGGSDQQVVGWGKSQWEQAKKDGAISSEEYEAAKARGEFSEDDPRFTVTFWKAPPGQTYFSVDFNGENGPLRGNGENPADEAFISAIRDERRCPEELEAMCKGKEPLVDLVDKTSEEYVYVKPKFQAFASEGMSLGGAPKVELDASAPVMEVDYKFVLDESAKTTKLQLNFHDGSKIVQKFNLTHTVQDIRLFMESQKPLPFGTCYELRTAYDKRLLDEPSVTILDGKLKGESLMQTLA